MVVILVIIVPHSSIPYEPKVRKDVYSLGLEVGFGSRVSKFRV